MTPLDYAAQAIARCAAGFENEHEWLNWKKKHRTEIRELPRPLRNKVILAWEQASAKEFSRPLRTATPTPPGADGAERGEEES